MIALVCAIVFCALCLLSIVGMVWSNDKANASVTEYRGNDWISNAYEREIGDKTNE